ncbi:MAG: LysE family transporter [Saprospiraceae bacterium]|nr:LysE family transporter [Saprospiraceae bacterium]MDW8483888.1 LysE family transporter [Saprospiraceae bacterium]
MLWQGMLLGLSLSLLIGPLLFAIVEASLSRGFRAGVALAAGIWLSDLMYMIIAYRWLDVLIRLTALPNFRLWAGLAGGLMLMLFGGVTMLRKGQPPERQQTTAADRLLDILDGPEPPGVAHNWMAWGYPGYLLRGFLLNTINPFTVFFWLGLASAFIVSNQLTSSEVLTFFGGMLGALMFVDILKAYAAKRVRNLLQAYQLRRAQRLIGAVLIAFGAALFIQMIAAR